MPKKLMRTWSSMHPDWEYTIWTDASKGWANQSQIDLMPELCGKADLMRYEILMEHGGIFVDADSKCVQSLDGRFLEPECWAAYENEKKAPGMIANGYLGAERGCDLMREMVVACSRARVTDMPAWKCVGPVLFTRVAKNHPELTIFPARSLMPRHWTGAEAPGDYPIFAEQLWCGTKSSYELYS
jgi:mannosyltransferase OCH1-like enzyme